MEDMEWTENKLSKRFLHFATKFRVGDLWN